MADRFFTLDRPTKESIITMVSSTRKPYTMVTAKDSVNTVTEKPTPVVNEPTSGVNEKQAPVMVSRNGSRLVLCINQWYPIPLFKKE